MADGLLVAGYSEMGILLRKPVIAGLISTIAPGEPQPIPPNSSLRFQIKQRNITRADSISLSARFETTAPIAVTARHSPG